MFGKGPQAELMAELERLRRRVAELEADQARGVRVDALTGLLSPRALRGRLAEEIVRARRYQRPLSLAVLAIDDFAAIESLHGFKASDELITTIARRLREITRSHDLIGRSGPAEFVIILPDTVPEDARTGLERLLVELGPLGEEIVSGVSASLGLAGLEREMTPEALLATARTACQHAQGTGGGQAVLANELDGVAQESVRALQRDAIEALAVALTERDRYTGEHSAAVIEMSAGVARNMGLRATEVERVRSAALLHDIGKVAIPDEILHKPGPLSADEWLLMREHPVIGERILSVLPGMAGVARIVRHEHERWDGGGYPDGLSGEQIPIGSRIIIAADTYHAITSDRPYRPARSHSEAIEELTRCAGTQFDPAVTAALIGYLYGQRQAGAVLA
ncbi:MAG TPA: diguanylate cyclase [Solirubrobacteraceae bacterium]|nr:diguanylate cyclase [Solirubrobacteraceae bacterium]